MIKKIFVILLILCLSIQAVITLNILPSSLQIAFIIAFLFCIVFMVISVVFAIALAYNGIKRIFFEKPLDKIQQKIIKREPDVFLDGIIFVGASVAFALALYLLLNMTSILEVLNTMPGIQMLGLSESIKEKIAEAGSSGNQVLVAIIVSYIGPIMVFFMRWFHNTLSKPGKERFLGSKPFLGLFYSIVVVFGINLILNFISKPLEFEMYEIEINQNNFIITTFFSLGFATIAWFSDRLIFSKLYKK